MGLEAYWKKRHFEKTPEPRGEVLPRRGRARFFCVQKHAASHLHYDFRLELEGVLKSWAVPKGPSLDPKVRRLAMETEDHPLDYGEFEGIIPKGEYGGGTVLLWDRGSWLPLDDDPHRAYRSGKIRFELRGEKLRGGFLLERTWREGREGRAWRLTKLEDDDSIDGDITVERPESVATGRDLDAIARQADRVWRSNRGGHPGGEEKAKPRKKKALPKVSLAEPKPTSSLPRGEGWVHEIAIDGAHGLARIEGGSPSVHLARGDASARFPAVLRALRGLGVDDAILDVYLAELHPDGTTSAPREHPVGFAVDLLHLEGEDFRRKSLVERKQALSDLIASARKDAALRFVPHFEGTDVFEKACRIGATAMLSKKGDARYGSEILRTPCKKNDRVLYRADGYRKSDLAEYYRAVEEHVVPHVFGRPLTLVRANDAIEDGTIYMRHSKVWGPSTLERVSIVEKKKVGEYLVARDLDGILALVHMGIVEIHTWNSVAPEVDSPDRIVLDLDPDVSVPWTEVVDTAKMLRKRLEKLGLASFVKTTGGKGLHVVVPLHPTTWDASFAWSRTFAQMLEAEEPKRFTTQVSLAKRPGKILIDYLRNNRGNTSVAAFSTRAKPHAPISVPVSWAELGRVDPNSFTLKSVPKLRRKKDPWAGYEEARGSLPALERTSRQVRSAAAMSSSGVSPGRRSPRS